MIKTCTKCKKSKDIGEFYSSDLYWCKRCRSEYSRIKNGSVQIRKDLDNGNRICNKCKKEKTLEDFPKDKKCKLGHARTCKECVNRSRDPKREEMNEKKREYYIKHRNKVVESNKKYYQKNIEARRAYGRQHAKDNPEIYRAARHRRRAAIRNNGRNDLTADQIRWLFDNFSECIYCGIEDDLSIDHVKPISKGGQNTLDNVVVACMACNNKKRNKFVSIVGSDYHCYVGGVQWVDCDKCMELKNQGKHEYKGDLIDWDKLHANHI